MLSFIKHSMCLLNGDWSPKLAHLKTDFVDVTNLGLIKL